MAWTSRQRVSAVQNDWIEELAAKGIIERACVKSFSFSRYVYCCTMRSRNFTMRLKNLKRPVADDAGIWIPNPGFSLNLSVGNPDGFFVLAVLPKGQDLTSIIIRQVSRLPSARVLRYRELGPAQDLMAGRWCQMCLSFFDSNVLSAASSSLFGGIKGKLGRKSCDTTYKLLGPCILQ